MIDLKALRSDPARYSDGAAAKNIDVDVTRLLELDAARRSLSHEREEARSQQKSLGREIGPQIGALKGQLKSARGDDRRTIETQVAELEATPLALKARIQELDDAIAAIEPEFQSILLLIPQPPDEDVPGGESAADNVPLRTWGTEAFDTDRTFAENRGFSPRSHIELGEALGLFEFERGVRMAGSRSYILTGDGMRLHQALLQYALSLMTQTHGFTPISVPVVVREESMVGTGFFPTGRDQAYHIDETGRGGGHDLYLTGTGEVGLMSLHQGEIIDSATLPMKYVTVSTCFRREAGAAGKETAGLYRVHQFDKVEQVVICRADEVESRQWHAAMIEIVEHLLQSLDLPYRILQCCTADLGAKNADMIDIECWMPSRGEVRKDGSPSGDWGETHSASRLNDYQCRRLNLRYRDNDGSTVFCHSLNNTVVASPRLLIPLLEIHQQSDGSISIPQPLRQWMGGQESIRPS